MSIKDSEVIVSTDPTISSERSRDHTQLCDVSGLSFRMLRTSSGGRMKMLRCSSLSDEYSVLMSLGTRFHLFDAGTVMSRPSACAEGVGCLKELLSGLVLEPPGHRGVPGL